MEFINTTGNTVYLEDIDINIPYLGDDKTQHITSDLVSKSKSFQKLSCGGIFKIVKITDARIENNLKRLYKERSFLNDLATDDVGISDPLPRPSTAAEVEVQIRGHFYEAGGYAKVNRALALGLKKLGVNVSISPVNNKDNDLTESEMRELSCLKKNPSKDTIYIDSMIPSFSQVSSGKYKILYTTVESSTIPKQFIEAAAMYNEIWVTSDFCKEVLEKYNIGKKISVIPDIIDNNHYKDKGSIYEFKPKLKDFIFISVFGWSYRKGYDVLLSSFLKEFSGNDNVSLLIMSRFQNGVGNKDVIRETISDYIKKYGGDNPAHIVRCSRVIPESELPSLYRACNAFVLFSRGEGFGIPYAESSLCGLPVIGTNHSGQTMFLNKKNSYLLDIDRIAKVQPGTMHVHYWDNQEFPALKGDDIINEAGSLMRQVYKNYTLAKNKNKILQNKIKNDYDSETVSLVVKAKLDEIRETLC